jgi:ornithine cyclodeaminase
VPLRHHHFMPQPDGSTATILIMPAWQRAFIGIKIVTIFPENGKKALPGLFSSYLLCDGDTGQHIALIDGNEITSRHGGHRRAGRGFSRPQGFAQAADLRLRAHRQSAGRCVSRGAADRAGRGVERQRGRARRASCPICRREGSMRSSRPIWSARGRGGYRELRDAGGKADHQGAWLKAGTHLDLIGSFTPFMREADDEVFRRGHVWLDTYDALKESGELLDPIRDGVITADDIRGSLAELCRGERKGRTSESEITVFKAVGNALSDIAAAGLVSGFQRKG